MAETPRIHSPLMSHATNATRARYDRLAPFYDSMESLMERSVFGDLRRQLWSRVCGERILEVGVGTGKNMPYYPGKAHITGVDLSERMLERAVLRSRTLGLETDLRLMDAQQLDFADDTFDSAVASFVFCSVPDPCVGLHELGRVVKPDGDIWLLEHVRLNGPVSGRIMDLLNPVVVRVMGANINRRTVENVRAAGLVVAEVSPVAGELVQLIHAKPGAA